MNRRTTARVLGAAPVAVLLAAGCSDPTVCASLSGVPPAATQLLVRTTLRGQAAMVTSTGSDQYLTSDQTRFCVALPSGATGTFDLEVDALDSAGCSIAFARWADDVPDGARRYYTYNKVLAQSATLTQDGWCRLQLPQAQPQLADIHALWGSGPRDVWAIDVVGTTARWNGSEWSVAMQQDTTLHIEGMWGSSATDIWAVGPTDTMLHFGPDMAWTPMSSATWRLYDVSGQSAQDLWAVGAMGTIFHKGAGDMWPAQVPMVPASVATLRGVWESPQQAVWAVGESGTLFHRDGDGAPWTQDMPPTDQFTLNAVWGSGSDDLWAVGDTGVIWRKLGSQAWVSQDSSLTENNSLFAVWGSSASSVWVVGEEGLILHWDGNRWSKLQSGVNQTLRRIWGTASGEVWVAGEGGTLLHYAGGH